MRAIISAITALTTIITSAFVYADTTAPKELAYDLRLTDYPYPYEVKFHRFHSQEKTLEMAYMYLPPQNQNAVVTLLHGKNFNGAYWKQTAHYLHQKGYGVLIPDQIGFGKSSKPKHYQYSFSALANNTRNLMTSLGISKTIVIGHSMGGMLATRFALSYPQQTSKLLLVNPIGLENYLHYVEYKDVNFFYQNELTLNAEKIKRYQQKNYYDGKWNATYDSLTNPLVGWVQGPHWKDIAYVNALTYDMLFTQPVVEEFGDLSVSAALILGTRDRTGPGRNWMKPGVQYELGRYDQLGDRIQQRNQSIEIFELKDLGHLPQIEDFERFKAVLHKTLSSK